MFQVDHKDVIHDKLCKFWCFYLHHYVLGSWPRNKSQFTTYKEYRKRATGNFGQSYCGWLSVEIGLGLSYCGWLRVGIGLGKGMSWNRPMAVVRVTSIRRSWCMPPIERNIQSTYHSMPWSRVYSMDSWWWVVCIDSFL